MIPFYLIYLMLLTLITFVLYGVDKHRAQNNAWRIPEKVLLGASFIGGAIGGLLSMQLFRHKTKHWYFTAVNVLGIALHAAILFVLITRV